MHSDHAERLPGPASELAEGGAGEGVTLPPQEALLDDAGTGEATVTPVPARPPSTWHRRAIACRRSRCPITWC